MKKNIFIIIIVALAVVVVSEAALLFVFGKKINALAETTQKQNNSAAPATTQEMNNNDNQEIDLEELLMEFDYNDFETHYDYIENFILFVREKGNPDFMSGWKRPETDDPERQETFGPGRDDMYAGDNFTGTYVKDENSRLSKIPFYPAKELIYNSDIASCYLGFDASRLEYQNAGDGRLFWVMKYCPNEEMRERADGSRYLVYDTDDDCRLFLMLSPDSARPFIVGYPLLYKNELSYKDFIDIQPGDTMSEVSAIDDICEYYHKTWFGFGSLNGYSFENSGVNWPDFATIHYLTDGLLKIAYGSLNEDGDPVVKYVEYYPDYVLTTFTNKPLSYKLNPLDLK